MRDLFLKDPGWKLFSLLLAAGIWFTVHHILLETNSPSSDSTGSPVTYGNLPVFIVSTTEDVHLYHVVPDTVSVTVSGSREIIGKLQGNQIRATVDLTGIGTAKDLKCSVSVSVPSGVTLVSVEPQNVSVIVPPPPQTKP